MSTIAHIGGIIAAPRAVAQMRVDEMDAMRRHGALFLLTCHPFLSGRAGRVEALRSVIEAILERGDVAFAACLEVARRVREDPEAFRRPLAPVEVDPALYPED